MVWDPFFEEIRRLEDRMNRMFRSFWEEGPRLLERGKRGEIVPYTREYKEPYLDMIETDKDIIVTADMPGVDKKDIDIRVTENNIEISAETKREAEEKKEGYIFRERMAGKYYRSLTLPSSVDPEKVKASYKNGVLEVTLPKTEIKKKTVIKIE
ncbi:MAG TPA: Hsp20/alpha crystallin family protein [Methanosarcinales archaeon]|nr:Hsp20/alpha crystallin family protein [Methanosarcinales archaeon]